MAIRDSLRALGVNTGNLTDMVEGVNRLLLPKEQKLSLLARYESEEKVTIPADLYARVS